MSDGTSRTLAMENGVSLVYGYASANSKKSHVLAWRLLAADITKLCEAKCTVKVDKVLLISGTSYVRAFRIERTDSTGDICEATCNGLTTRFSMKSAEALAKDGGATCTVKTLAGAQKFADDSKQKWVGVTHGVSHVASMGQVIAEDDFRNAGIVKNVTTATAKVAATATATGKKKK